MKTGSTRLALGLTAALMLLAIACGAPTTPGGQASPVVISALGGSPSSGFLVVTDSSTPSSQLSAIMSSWGSFSVDVSTLKPPFTFSVSWTDGTSTKEAALIGAISTTALVDGTVTVTDAAGAQASSTLDEDGSYSVETAGMKSPYRVTVEFKHKGGKPSALDGAALYSSMGCVNCHGAIGSSDVKGKTASEIVSASKEIGAMTSITLSRQEAIAIASALASSPAPVPTHPTSDGAALYATYCASCHGQLAASEKLGATATQIQTAIANVGAMKGLSTLSSTQVQAIADALALPVTAPPSTCTYSYSSWSACGTNNLQTRTVLSSSPAGCTGSPVVSQSCTYAPPTCTGFAYSTWSACDTTGTQTRTVLSSTPSGCTGGTPVLSQSCTYVPPAVTCTSFTYSGWGTCQSDNTQTRTVLTSSPTGCTGGTPVLSQGCTYTPPAPTCTLANAVPSCGSCHGTPPSTHTGRPNTCAVCHGPVDNGTGTPSTGMTATLSGTTCVLGYPQGGTHNNGTVNRGGAL